MYHRRLNRGGRGPPPNPIPTLEARVSTGRPSEPTAADLLRAVRIAETRLLASLAEAFSVVDAVDDALERLLELSAGILDGAVAAVAVLEPDSGVLLDGPSRGFDRVTLLDEPMSIEGAQDALAIVAREGRAAAVPAEHVSPVATRAGIGAGIIFPLAVRRDGVDIVVGVLLVAHADGRLLSGDEVRLAEGIAGLAASIVERGMLQDAARARIEWRERLAQIDALTGLANRRTFDHVGELEVARAIRQELPLAVVVADVDEFEQRREVDGATAADAILRRVAVAVAEGVRLVDTVARLGESQFVVLAPGSGGDTVARRIAAAVDALEPVGAWTARVSTGVAHVPEDGTRLEDLIAAASSEIERTRATAG